MKLIDLMANVISQRIKLGYCETQLVPSLQHLGEFGLFGTCLDFGSGVLVYGTSG